MSLLEVKEEQEESSDGERHNPELNSAKQGNLLNCFCSGEIFNSGILRVFGSELESLT